MISAKNIFLLLAICGILSACKPESKPAGPINFNHLYHLYMDVDLPDGHKGGIVHIYSEYPDYHYEIEADEGFACVDDIARALGLMSMIEEPSAVQLEMMERMASFLLYMQNENGYFNNFVWHDLSINTTYRTSIAEPNWWSWRALWALTGFTTDNNELEERIKKASSKLLVNLIGRYVDLYDTVYYGGIASPAWIPAGDQAAVMILGMINYYENISADDFVLKAIAYFSDGLLLCQIGNEDEFPYGAYLSWRNLWHAYGNLQAYTMLKAGVLLGNDKYIKSALLEIDHFYPFLAENYFPEAFYVVLNKDGTMKPDYRKESQIAYNFRPMIWASMQAYEITGDEKYKHQAVQIASWFSGSNRASAIIYDPATGRCFDGIAPDGTLNKNSGAESTIEALLALKMMDQHIDATELNGIYDK